MMVPYFDPPVIQLAYSMEASKAIAGIQNCASQLALKDGVSQVTPIHVYAALRICLAAMENYNTIPSGLTVDSAYKPNGAG